MSQTKRISKRTRAVLKKAKTAPVLPGAVAATPSLTERARLARVEAVRDAISDPAFNLDAAFARAMQVLLKRGL